jgi:hypothetical protein
MNPCDLVTPRPWGLYDDGPEGSDIIRGRVDDDNYDLAVIPTEEDEGRPYPERKANAEHVLKCVNNHDALLHTITVLRDGVNLAVENWKQQTPEQKELFREKLRIADAALEGGQP